MASSSEKLENMEIKEMQVVPCTNSPYIQSSRVTFKQVYIVRAFYITSFFYLQNLHTSVITEMTRCNKFIVVFFPGRMELKERGTI